MPIRLLMTCGLLAVACPVSAQFYSYGHGHEAAAYDRHVAANHHNHHYHYRGLHSRAFSYGPGTSHFPVPYQDEELSCQRGVAYGEFESGYEVAVAHIDSCSESFGCPFQRGGGYPDSGHQHRQHGDLLQHGSEPFFDGRARDHDHPHGSPATPFELRGDVERLPGLPRNQVPMRDPMAPRIQTVPLPSDRQPLTPPALPPSSFAAPSLETPLGDGPPPNTVPLS
jgi:hypothetical protein